MDQSYREDLKIDQNNLHREWESQPMLFMKWAEASVQAQFERDEAKSRLDVCRAKLDGEIRANPGNYGIEKITEAAIQSAITLHKDYSTANSNYINSVQSAKILDAAREAFDHKKKALEKITDLYISGYYSAPNVNPKAKEVAEENRTKAVQTEMQKSRISNITQKGGVNDPPRTPRPNTPPPAQSPIKRRK